VHAQLTAVGLIVLGVPYALVALMFPFAGAFGAANDPEFRDLGELAWVFGATMGCVASMFVGGFASLWIAGGVGLLLRRKWGWIASLVGLALLTSGCCAPIAIYGFWALLREPVRKAYGLS
jgi:hypothetical protein